MSLNQSQPIHPIWVTCTPPNSPPANPILSNVNQANPILSELWAKHDRLSSVQYNMCRNTFLLGHDSCRLSCGHMPLPLDQKQHQQVQSRHEYVIAQCTQTHVWGFYLLEMILICAFKTILHTWSTLQWEIRVYRHTTVSEGQKQYLHPVSTNES